METISREELERTVDVTEWWELRAHLERGGVIVVGADLSLVDAALKIAADDTASVSQWIDKGALAKPSLQQIEQWNSDNKKSFSVLIVSPYVLIQEISQLQT
jgi:hypothetical protein